MAQTVRFNEVLAGLDVDRVHVLGMSQGAWHASVIALHGPERLASVTLIEPNAIFGKMKWRVLFKIMKFAVHPSDANWRKMTAWLTPGVEMIAEQFDCARAAMAYRTSLGWARVLKDEELQSITTPLLAIFGGDSVACDPVRDVERITVHLPNAQTRIYPGMGHGVLDQIPEQVVPRILRFLAERDRVGVGG